MENNGLKYGILAGLGAIAVSLGFYLVEEKMIFSVAGYVGWAIYLYCMYKATVDERAEMGGFMTFKEALKPAFLTFVVASFIYFVFYYVLFNFIDPNLAELQKEIAMESMQGMGGLMGEETLENMMEEMEKQDFQVGIGTVSLSYAISLIFPGFIFALIIALIAKKEQPIGA